ASSWTPPASLQKTSARLAAVERRRQAVHFAPTRRRLETRRDGNETDHDEAIRRQARRSDRRAADYDGADRAGEEATVRRELGLRLRRRRDGDHVAAQPPLVGRHRVPAARAAQRGGSERRDDVLEA